MSMLPRSSSSRHLPTLRRAGLMLGLIAMLAVAAPLLAGENVSFQEVEESLTCQCGCGLTVHSCNHVTCDSAIPLRAEIRAKIDEGKGKEEILLEFATKYGEKILSSPTTVGFNLMAWVMPFVVVVTAILLVLLVVVRWGRRKPPPPPASPPRSQGSAALRDIMERELESYKA